MTYSWWEGNEIISTIENESDLSNKAKQVSEDLSKNMFEITLLVEKLGPVLTSTNVSHRSKGVELLSQILTKLPTNFLREKQLDFIILFYKDRLKDHHSVIPAILTGIQALSKMKNKSDVVYLDLLMTMLDGTISCQSQVREDRTKIFQIIEISSRQYEKLLKEKGSDFIYGVINALEGERDPRNLLLLFTFMPEFIERYPLGHLAEEMFEVFACYFPIDFYPSPNDPSSITRDILAEELSKCLCATKEFVEHCLILLLEKIESQLKVAKLDSLILLSKCALKYGSDIIEEQFPTIWTAVKNELLPGSDIEVVEQALQTLNIILKSTNGDSRICENILNIIFHTISISFCDINMRLFAPSIKVAFACAKSNAQSAIYVANKLLPMFLRQIENLNGSEDDQIIGLLELVRQIGMICKQKNVLEEIEKDYLTTIQNLFVKYATESRKKELLIISYDALSEFCQLLDANNRNLIYCSLLELLQNGQKNSIDVSGCIKQFTKYYPEEISQSLISKMLEDYFITEKNADIIYQVLCHLIDIPYFTDVILKFLITNIFEQNNSTLLFIVLKNVKWLLKNNSNSAIMKEFVETHDIIDKLFNFVRERKTLSNEILLKVSKLLRIIISTLCPSDQEKIIKKYLPQIITNENNDLYLLIGILGNLQKDVNLDDDLSRIAMELINYSLAIDEDNFSDRILECSHLLCTLFNRSNNTEKFNAALSDVIELLKAKVSPRNKALEILAWITKGILIAGHNKTFELLKSFISYLNVPEISPFAIKCFEILSSDPNKLHLVNIKPFYKQKLFVAIHENLLPKNDTKLPPNQLLALSYVLKEMPLVILKMHIKNIGPIIFQCLEMDNSEAIYIALDIINRFIKLEDVFCQNHIQYLIPQLLKLTRYKSVMKIRIFSLDCLYDLSKYPTYLLIPFKQDVLLGLLDALDDHKRLVRTAAVRTRTCWFMIDASKDSNVK